MSILLLLLHYTHTLHYVEILACGCSDSPEGLGGVSLMVCSTFMSRML